MCALVRRASRARLDLYDRFHDFQADHKNWPLHPNKDAASYSESFVHNPSFTEEWDFYLEDRLVGVGYADRLAAGMSAIYFLYDPDLRDRSLGTFNVLCLLNEIRPPEIAAPVPRLLRRRLQLAGIQGAFQAESGARPRRRMARFFIVSRE